MRLGHSLLDVMSKISRLRNTLTPCPPPHPTSSGSAADDPAETRIAELVAEVYDAAPASERGRLIEQLLRPLGVLSLVAIADGIFASIRFRSGWEALHVRLEDLGDVQATHVLALVKHAQQVSVETVDGLAQMLVASPVLMGSAAAVALVTVLLARAARRGEPVMATLPVANGPGAALASPLR